MVVEPVLGTGAVPLTADYITALLELRRRHGFLLVADEVATGFGRTGSYFASQRWPERPDLVIASKGLTNGTSAAAAVIVAAHVADTFDAANSVFVHGETQAGTPVTGATILATVAEMHRLEAVEAGRQVSAQLDHLLADLVEDDPRVERTTGVGCFRSVRLRTPDGSDLPQSQVPLVIAAIRQEGAIVHPGVHGFQLMPALIYPPEELAELMGCVRRGLDAYFVAAATGPGAAAVVR